MKFELEIELGNDAMKTPRHVRQALQEVITKLKADGFGQKCANGTCAESIRDQNGNTVGYYKYRKQT
jgi:hypothetical protein